MDYLRGIIDFHAHILPNIDDGSSSAQESVKMLKIMQNQGVSLVLATPHFYDARTSIEDFLEKRDKSYKLLTKEMERQNVGFPKIKLAAEVHFSYEILENPKLDLLCAENSRCILIEMPYSTWYDWMYEGIEIIKSRNLIPVLVHLERYADFSDGIRQIEKILELDVYVQINADSFMKRKSLKVIDKLFKMNKVHLIGSDAHDALIRPPKIHRAEKKIINKYGKKTWSQIQQNAFKLLNL